MVSGIKTSVLVQIVKIFVLHEILQLNLKKKQKKQSPFDTRWAANKFNK